MQRFIGIAVVIICVFGGFVMASGRLISLWQPAELVIILGAGIGSLIIGNSQATLHLMRAQLAGVFKRNKDHSAAIKELLLAMHELLEIVRKKGLKGLDHHVENWQQSSIFLQYPLLTSNADLMQFITDNLRMLSMGKISPHELDHLLEQEIMTMEQTQLKPSDALHATADAMPGFGILAAVMGIIITMTKLDGPLITIGLHVAAALVGTFIGIFMCYCLLEPLSKAMAANVHKNTLLFECAKTILVSHCSGKSPILALDAGRKILDVDTKPGFIELERWIDEKELKAA